MRITVDADIVFLTLTLVILFTFCIAKYSAASRLSGALENMHQCDVMSVLLEHYTHTYQSWSGMVLDVLVYRTLSLVTIAMSGVMVLKVCRQKTTTNRQIGAWVHGSMGAWEYGDMIAWVCECMSVWIRIRVRFLVKARVIYTGGRYDRVRVRV